REVDRRDALCDAAVDLVERRHIRIDRHEHQALPLVHAQRRQADVLDLEVAGVLHLRRAAQLAFERVGPAVILAVQGADALAVAQRQRPGAVAADVGEGAQHTVLSAHQQYRHAGDLLDHVVARLGQLSLLGHQLPAAREHRAVLHRQHRLAGVVARRQGVCAVEFLDAGVGWHVRMRSPGWHGATGRRHREHPCPARSGSVCLIAARLSIAPASFLPAPACPLPADRIRVLDCRESPRGAVANHATCRALAVPSGMRPARIGGIVTAGRRMTEAAVTGTLEQAMARAAQLLEREPALAVEQLAEILQAAPGHPAALRLLAAARSLQGNLSGALAILVPLAHARPDWALIQHDLGLALQRCGRGAEAIEALRRAVSLQPDLPQAWRALGDGLLAAGEPAAADAAYVSHVRHATRVPQLMAAAVALAENRIPEAEARLREQLKQAPTDVAAIRMFAEVAARLGRNEDALHLLERCLELAPGFHEARRNYALVLHRANRPEPALAEVERLLAADPEDAGSRNLKAAVLCRTGDYEQAIGIYAALLERHPDNPKLWVSQGHALKTAGHTGRAIAAYRRSLELEPSFGEVWWSLANLKT